MTYKKPRAPKNLMSETVIDLHVDFPTALERLEELNGAGREVDSNGEGIAFYSNRKGRFTSTYTGRRRYQTDARAVDMRGGLYIEDGKTKAVVYTYRLGGTVFGMIMEVVLGVLVLLWGLLEGYTYLQAEFSARTLTGCALLLLIAIALPIHGIISLEKGKRGSESDAEKMKQDALRRLDAINQWDK